MELDTTQGIGQCHRLEKMNLRGSTLTNSLKCLFQSAFPCLKALLISGTNLNSMDKEHLGQAIQTNFFPVLELLDVSHNNLRACAPKLLSGIKSGALFRLKELAMINCNLCEIDVRSIMKCLQSGKLQSLEKLNLKINPFDECEAEIEELIRYCVENWSDREF